MISLSISPGFPYVLCPQHTAQAVFATAHPAPCLLTLHRRGGCQLQSQQQPSLKSPPQTHAPLLQGHGLWPVSPTTALRAEEQISVWNPTDWATSAMNGSVWVTWGGVLLVHTSMTLLPTTSTSEQNWSLRLWGGFGGRAGWGASGHPVILTHPQCPPRSAFHLLLFPCTVSLSQPTTDATGDASWASLINFHGCFLKSPCFWTIFQLIRL